MGVMSIDRHPNESSSLYGTERFQLVKAVYSKIGVSDIRTNTCPPRLGIAHLGSAASTRLDQLSGAWEFLTCHAMGNGDISSALLIGPRK